MTNLDIVETAMGLVEGLVSSNQRGPFTLLLPADQARFLDAPYVEGDSTTLRQRLLQIDEIVEIKSKDSPGIALQPMKIKTSTKNKKGREVKETEESEDAQG